MSVDTESLVDNEAESHSTSLSMSVIEYGASIGGEDVDATSDTLRLFTIFVFVLCMFWNIILWVNVFYLLVFGLVDVSDVYKLF